MKIPFLAEDAHRRDAARQVRSWTPEAFRAEMSAQGVQRAFLAFENGRFTLSHPRLLAPLQAFFELSQDFDRHEAVFFENAEAHGTLFCAFVHDTRRGLAQGGLRFWRYESLASLLVDGLRLAQGMTRKNALAGLWWGGGKGIIQLPPGFERPEQLALDDPRRQSLFEAYGAFIASLGGIYYTAEDVGTKTPDMGHILGRNRFVTCIARDLGGSGNPSPHTALGVLRGIQAAWRFLFDRDDLKGVRVAVQGVGNVGAPLVQHLVRAGARVWIADPNLEATAALRERYPEAITVVGHDAVYDLDVDVFSPCALGATVNQDTIPRLRVRLVCGAANNILREGELDAQRLAERGIAFVPDFLCNRMGITNCADEWMGYLEEDVRAAVERVYPDSLRVLRHARQQGVTSLHAANQLADIAAAELNPLFGHRGRRLLDHLIASGWHLGSARRHRVAGTLEPLFRPSIHEAALRSSRRWQQRDHGRGPSLAAAPISAASRPNLASVSSALLVDVRARSLEALGTESPRRVVGSEHGGLALQLAVERTLPMERTELERSDFVERCHDAYSSHDAAIRDQLHRLGIGFDPGFWLDPMEERVGPVVERLFHALADAGRLRWERFLEHRCPHCRTVLVDSDLEREPIRLRERTWVRFPIPSGGHIEVVTYAPEELLGTVALAIRPDNPAAGAGGVRHPLTGELLPLLLRPELPTHAALIAPAFSQVDLRLALEAGLSLTLAPFDEEGRLLIPGQEGAVPREAVASLLQARLADHARVEAVDLPGQRLRCARCGTAVHPDTSEQLFAHLGDAAERLVHAVQGGAIRHSEGPWQDEVLAAASAPEPWCISRQFWWGNEIPASALNAHPARSGWVFSTWFSQVAWTLAGLGWPQSAAPEPIAEVFVDHERLRRWVVPSQLVSLALYGRPAFRTVHVHGTVQVFEARREPISTQGSNSSARGYDEERMVLRSRRSPMRRQLGNVVEPGVLVQRFGADALRLGFLLAGAGEPRQGLLLEEGHLRQGRALVRRLIGKLTGLHHGLQSEPDGTARLGDLALVELAEAIAGRTRRAFEDLHFRTAARELATAVRLWSRYTDLAFTRRTRGETPGAPRAAVAASLATLRPWFAPLCPFLFEHVEPKMFHADPDSSLDPELRSVLRPLVASPVRERDAIFRSLEASVLDRDEVLSLLRTVAGVARAVSPSDPTLAA